MKKIILLICIFWVTACWSNKLKDPTVVPQSNRPVSVPVTHKETTENDQLLGKVEHLTKDVLAENESLKETNKGLEERIVVLEKEIAGLKVKSNVKKSHKKNVNGQKKVTPKINQDPLIRASPDVAGQQMALGAVDSTSTMAWEGVLLGVILALIPLWLWSAWRIHSYKKSQPTQPRVVNWENLAHTGETLVVGPHRVRVLPRKANGVFEKIELPEEPEKAPLISGQVWYNSALKRTLRVVA